MPLLLQCRRCFRFTICCLLLAGCGGRPSTDYSDLDLVEVTGRVSLDGAPLEGARVEFESPDRSASYGRTDAGGEYRLMFNSERSGCLTGEKVVRITMSAAVEDEEDPDAAGSGAIMVPARYNTESELRANVSASEREFHFDLVSSDTAAAH